MTIWGLVTKGRWMAVTDMVLESGWMPGVTRIPNADHGYPDVPVDDMWPKAAMFHVMQGFRRTMDDWALSPVSEQKSSHFGISRTCTQCIGGVNCPNPLLHIRQYVSIWNPAWAAGDVNNPDPWGQTMLNRYGPNPNKWAIHIEGEGFSIPVYSNGQQVHDYIYDRDHPWPEAMVQASILILKFVLWSTQPLADEPRKQDLILTHSQTNRASRAQDPGDKWITDVKPRLSAAVMEPFAVPAPPSAPPASLPAPPAALPVIIDARVKQAREYARQSADILDAVIG